MSLPLWGEDTFFISVKKDLTANQKRTLKRRNNKLRYQGQLSRMDRIRASYFGEEELSEADEDYRKVLEEINQHLVAGMPREHVAKLVIAGGKRKRSQAYGLMRDAVELFGDITESNKKGMRAVLAEQYMILADEARKEKDLNTWKQALDSYAKLNGLHDTSDKVPQRQQILVVGFSEDPEVLQEEEIESDYVEIE